MVDRIFSCGVLRVVFLLSLQAPNSTKMPRNNRENPWVDMENRILTIEESKFNTLAAEIYRWQQSVCGSFHQWCELNNYNSHNPTFLPIQFFKTHTILSIEAVGEKNTGHQPNFGTRKERERDQEHSASFLVAENHIEPYLLFESSGTTLNQPSKHWVLNPALYQRSFVNTFEQRFGNVQDLCIIGLLPAYLERKNSSLVYMVDHLINRSNHVDSGFYLYEYEKLWSLILHNENHQIPTVVFGVTFALLELAEYVNSPSAPHNQQNPPSFAHIQWIETGGMKGRGKELTRAELHDRLKTAFCTSSIESEYGMTELLSQAYTRPSDGRFQCPPWMKVMICDPMDPQDFLPWGKTGRICIIDLANLYSCSFIATDDLGKCYEDGSFEVLGRIDFSDLRGCNQLM